MAGVEQGYEDECFESVVSKNYHCVICFNVFKDPVMCRNNEHLFCRACITRHLKNSQTCPSCMDELSIDTLREAPRIVTNCLSEFKIRCEFFHRGCQFVELGELESHVEECGYAPAVCSNEGCGLEVNRRDLIHHETAICEQRKVKCHNCEGMRQELIKVNEKLDNMEAKFTQLNDTLKEINGNLAAQNEKMNRLEALEATATSFQHNNREIQGTAKHEYTEPQKATRLWGERTCAKEEQVTRYKGEKKCAEEEQVTRYKGEKKCAEEEQVTRYKGKNKCAKDEQVARYKGEKTCAEEEQVPRYKGEKKCAEEEVTRYKEEKKCAKDEQVARYKGEKKCAEEEQVARYKGEKKCAEEEEVKPHWEEKKAPKNKQNHAADKRQASSFSFLWKE